MLKIQEWKQARFEEGERVKEKSLRSSRKRLEKYCLDVEFCLVNRWSKTYFLPWRFLVS